HRPAARAGRQAGALRPCRRGRGCVSWNGAFGHCPLPLPLSAPDGERKRQAHGERGGMRGTQKWLSVVGIGEDGAAGLGDAAKRLIGEAEFVFGGTRHLALAAPLIRGEARAWPSPFDTAMREVVALRGRRVCVLASGDPFL